MSSRRSFLVSATATAGAAAVWTFTGADADPVRWCSGTVYPLCEKHLRVTGLEEGLAHCHLFYRNPKGSDWQRVDSRQVTLQAGVSTLKLVLPNMHREYVAGQHAFYVMLEKESRTLSSPIIGYTLRPFHFGA